MTTFYCCNCFAPTKSITQPSVCPKCRGPFSEIKASINRSEIEEDNYEEDEPKEKLPPVNLKIPRTLGIKILEGRSHNSYLFEDVVKNQPPTGFKREKDKRSKKEILEEIKNESSTSRQSIEIGGDENE